MFVETCNLAFCPNYRGGLQISEHKAGYSCRIVAHLSQLACSRVSEEAKLFPGMLSSELRPRSTVWPKGFEHSGPRDGNIALYFFPDSERCRFYQLRAFRAAVVIIL